MGYTSPTSFPGMGGYCAVASFVCNLLIGCGMQHVNTKDLEVDVDEDEDEDLDQEHEVSSCILISHAVCPDWQLNPLGKGLC